MQQIWEGSGLDDPRITQEFLAFSWIVANIPWSIFWIVARFPRNLWEFQRLWKGKIPSCPRNSWYFYGTMQDFTGICDIFSNFGSRAVWTIPTSPRNSWYFHGFSPSALETYFGELPDFLGICGNLSDSGRGVPNCHRNS